MVAQTLSCTTHPTGKDGIDFLPSCQNGNKEEKEKNKCYQKGEDSNDLFSLPKNYVTRYGALMIFRERYHAWKENNGCATLNGEEKPEQRTEEIVEQTCEEGKNQLKTLKELRRIVLDFGMDDTKTFKEFSRLLNDDSFVQVRAGFTPNRYLASLTKLWDPTFIEKFLENNSINKKILKNYTKLPLPDVVINDVVLKDSLIQQKPKHYTTSEAVRLPPLKHQSLYERLKFSRSAEEKSVRKKSIHLPKIDFTEEVYQENFQFEKGVEKDEDVLPGQSNHDFSRVESSFTYPSAEDLANEQLYDIHHHYSRLSISEKHQLLKSILIMNHQTHYQQSDIHKLNIGFLSNINFEDDIEAIQNEFMSPRSKKAKTRRDEKFPNIHRKTNDRLNEQKPYSKNRIWLSSEPNHFPVSTRRRFNVDSTSDDVGHLLTGLTQKSGIDGEPVSFPAIVNSPRFMYKPSKLTCQLNLSPRLYPEIDTRLKDKDVTRNANITIHGHRVSSASTTTSGYQSMKSVNILDLSREGYSSSARTYNNESYLNFYNPDDDPENVNTDEKYDVFGSHPSASIIQVGLTDPQHSKSHHVTTTTTTTTPRKKKQQLQQEKIIRSKGNGLQIEGTNVLKEKQINQHDYRTDGQIDGRTDLMDNRSFSADENLSSDRFNVPYRLKRSMSVDSRKLDGGHDKYEDSSKYDAWESLNNDRYSKEVQQRRRSVDGRPTTNGKLEVRDLYSINENIQEEDVLILDEVVQHILLKSSGGGQNLHEDLLSAVMRLEQTYKTTRSSRSSSQHELFPTSSSITLKSRTESLTGDTLTSARKTVSRKESSLVGNNEISVDENNTSFVGNNTSAVENEFLSDDVHESIRGNNAKQPDQNKNKLKEKREEKIPFQYRKEDDEKPLSNDNYFTESSTKNGTSATNIATEEKGKTEKSTKIYEDIKQRKTSKVKATSKKKKSKKDKSSKKKSKTQTDASEGIENTDDVTEEALANETTESNNDSSFVYSAEEKVEPGMLRREGSTADSYVRKETPEIITSVNMRSEEIGVISEQELFTSTVDTVPPDGGTVSTELDTSANAQQRAEQAKARELKRQEKAAARREKLEQKRREKEEERLRQANEKLREEQLAEELDGDEKRRQEEKLRKQREEEERRLASEREEQLRKSEEEKQQERLLYEKQLAENKMKRLLAEKQAEIEFKKQQARLAAEIQADLLRKEREMLEKLNREERLRYEEQKRREAQEQRILDEERKRKMLQNRQEEELERQRQLKELDELYKKRLRRSLFYTNVRRDDSLLQLSQQLSRAFTYSYHGFLPFFILDSTIFNSTKQAQSGLKDKDIILPDLKEFLNTLVDE